MFQDDFCQQVFEVLVEVFRKEGPDGLSRGQVTEGCQPGEAVQSPEQLRDRWGALGGEERGTGHRGQGSTPCLPHTASVIQQSPTSPEASVAG